VNDGLARHFAGASDGGRFPENGAAVRAGDQKVTTRSLISAAARGALRVWKQQAAARYAQYEAAYLSMRGDPALYEFVGRNSTKGRARAFNKLRRRIGDAAVLQGLRLGGPNPIGVWVVIVPREAVRVDSTDPAFGQDCVVVNYVLAGMGPDGCELSEGLWTVELPDHALGRALQRAPDQDLDALVLAAHRAVLQARWRGAFTDPRHRFLVPAGAGAFMCSMQFGLDPSAGASPSALVHAHTWLDRDQLRDDQEAEAASFVVDGAADEKRLGNYLLLPRPLRQIEARPIGTDGNVLLNVTIWRPGLPETIETPRARREKLEKGKLRNHPVNTALWQF
jgi:hypothetical protein